MSKFKFEMGVPAEDIITGFKGVIISRSQWLTGCNTYGLKPKIDKAGKVQDTQWFDENSIKVNSKKSVKIGSSVDGKTGGPQDTPMQANH